MHPILMSELIHQHQAELLHDAEHHRLVAAVRRSRPVASLRRRTTHRRAGPVPG